MREIKFEAWDKDNKRMIRWEELQYCSNFILAYGDGLRQFTGLKDKNGKEIYEGDVICHRLSNNKNLADYHYGDEGIVEWHENIGAWSWEHGEEWGKIDAQDVEVIGNIYENPELVTDIT